MEILSHLLIRRKILLVWSIALATIILLGALHRATEAEYAFASAMIIPVFLVTWVGGFRHGIAASTLAVLTWMGVDIVSEREFPIQWIPLLNGFARLATYTFVVYLTARVRTLLQNQISQARHDALTGLMNRRAFIEAGEAEVNRALRYGHPISVLFLDLDNFKQLNDSCGHDRGDAALKAVAIALESSLRTTDSVSRLGGDEFAIILPEVDCAAATEAANKIAEAVKASLAEFSPVTASLGVAWFKQAEEKFSVMLTAADTLMYEMKEDGKGGIRLRSFT